MEEFNTEDPLQIALTHVESEFGFMNKAATGFVEILNYHRV